MKKYLLPKDGDFYKANLHMHTNISDGKMTIEETKQELINRINEYFSGNKEI